MPEVGEWTEAKAGRSGEGELRWEMYLSGEPMDSIKWKGYAAFFSAWTEKMQMGRCWNSTLRPVIMWGGGGSGTEDPWLLC